MNKEFTALKKAVDNPKVPLKTKFMIESLSESGKDVLNSFLDKNSSLYYHSQPQIICKKFWASPQIFPYLYHYTTLEGVKGILSSGTFRIGSQYHMNDRGEHIYVTGFAKQILISLKASQNEIETFLKWYGGEIFDIYIWSFTKNDHSQALMTYGDYALEFNNQEIQTNLSKFLNPNVNDPFRFKKGNSYVFPLKVEYDRSCQEEYLKPIMAAYLKAYRNLRADPDDMKEIIYNCFRALSLFSICFKNPNLYQEEEIRFVVLKINNDNRLHPDKVVNGKPVILFPFDLKMIKSVIYSWQVEDLRPIKSILQEYHLSNRLERTKLPYGK